MSLIDWSRPSTITAIVYFSLYFLLVVIIGIYVKIHGKHEKFTSGKYIKDLWSQREIYAAILAHFYDTATDVGVLLNWYYLMKDELNGTNYKSVDMRIYFYSGLVFMFLYRICVLIGTCYQNNSKCYDWLLAIFDLYIIKAVFESMRNAEAIISKRQQKHQKQIEMNASIDANIDDENNNNSVQVSDATLATQEAKNILLKRLDTSTGKGEIKLSDLQEMVQMAESVTESMPQVILQTAFIVRAVNDPKLNEETDTILILLSIIASVISIGNKYRWLDKKSAKNGYNSINVEFVFPFCINYWYITIGVWRYCDIIVRFVVFSLIWGVMGGAFLPIYFILSYLSWLIASIFMFNDHDQTKEHKHDCLKMFTIALVNIVGVWSSPKWKYHLLKWIENGIALAIIGIFAYSSFKCSICATPEERSISDNFRIKAFYYMGCVAWFIEIVTVIPLQRRKVFNTFDDF